MTATAALVAAFSLAGCGASSDGLIGGDGSVQRVVGQAETDVGQLDPSKTLRPQFVSAGDGRSHYKIGPTDVLNISVFQADELNRKVQVGASGAVGMPLIGQVRAAGRTAQELEADIASRLKARYMQSPQVTVFIDEYNSQKVTVGGAVKKPGIFPVKGDMSLLQSIAAAEGMDTIADPSNVVIFREQGGARYVAKFDINQIRSGTAKDPLLQDRDVVMVDNSAVRTALRDFGQPISGTLTGLGSTATFISVVK